MTLVTAAAGAPKTLAISLVTLTAVGLVVLAPSVLFVAVVGAGVADLLPNKEKPDCLTGVGAAAATGPLALRGLLASLASRSARLAETRPRLLVLLGIWPMKAQATPRRAKSSRLLNIVLWRGWRED